MIQHLNGWNKTNLQKITENLSSDWLLLGWLVLAAFGFFPQFWLTSLGCYCRGQGFLPQELAAFLEGGPLARVQHLGSALHEGPSSLQGCCPLIHGDVQGLLVSY